MSITNSLPIPFYGIPFTVPFCGVTPSLAKIMTYIYFKLMKKAKKNQTPLPSTKQK